MAFDFDQAQAEMKKRGMSLHKTIFSTTENGKQVEKELWFIQYYSGLTEPIWFYTWQYAYSFAMKVAPF